MAEEGGSLGQQPQLRVQERHLAGCKPPAPTAAWDPGPRWEHGRRAGTPATPARGGSLPQATRPVRRRAGVAERPHPRLHPESHSLVASGQGNPEFLNWAVLSPDQGSLFCNLKVEHPGPRPDSTKKTRM